MLWTTKLKALRATTKKDPIIHLIAMAISLMYGVIYYFSAGFIQFNATNSFHFIIINDPLDRMWQQRGPFLYEAIGQIKIPYLATVGISIPNLLLGGLLMILVFLNILFFIMAIRHPLTCSLGSRRKGGKIMALFPALFAGFGCCAPSLVLLWLSIFGSVSSVLLITTRWLMPIGLLALTLSLITSYRQFKPL